MEIGYVSAFIGGVLALLSPCSALLLPAFFASTLGARLRLLVHGGVFYVGLLITLIPFGLGLGALGSLIVTHRGLIIAIASALLVLLGLAQTFGLGFDLSRLMPGAAALERNSATRTGFLRTLLLGMVSGVAGFCAGPILGAILTLALTQGSVWGAGAMMAVYAAGMVVPLVIIAALWQRIGARGQRWLRGRTFTLLGWEFHTTSVITGLLIVAVGVLFWTTNGLIGVPSLVPTDVQSWLQSGGSVLANPLVDVLAIVAVAGVALVIWAYVRRRGERREPESLASD